MITAQDNSLPTSSSPDILIESIENILPDIPIKIIPMDINMIETKEIKTNQNEINIKFDIKIEHNKEIQRRHDKATELLEELFKMYHQICIISDLVDTNLFDRFKDVIMFPYQTILDDT